MGQSDDANNICDTLTMVEVFEQLTVLQIAVYKCENIIRCAIFTVMQYAAKVMLLFFPVETRNSAVDLISKSHKGPKKFLCI